MEDRCLFPERSGLKTRGSGNSQAHRGGTGGQTKGSSGFGAAGRCRLLGSFGYLDTGNHKENLVVWILLRAFTWFSLHKLMIVLTVFKQICCFSFDLPLLFPSRSSPCCKLAGQVMVFFMLIVLVLPLNSSQMFAEGCFTLNHSSPPFSFYFPPLLLQLLFTKLKQYIS